MAVWLSTILAHHSSSPITTHHRTSSLIIPHQLRAEEALATALAHHAHHTTTTLHTIHTLQADAAQTAQLVTQLQADNASLTAALHAATERESVARSQEKLHKDGYHRKVVQLEAQLAAVRKECAGLEGVASRWVVGICACVVVVLTATVSVWSTSGTLAGPLLVVFVLRLIHSPLHSTLHHAPTTHLTFIYPMPSRPPTSHIAQQSRLEGEKQAAEDRCEALAVAAKNAADARERTEGEWG